MKYYWELLPQITQDKVMRAGLENARSVMEMTNATLKKHRFTPDEIELIRHATAETVKIPCFNVKEMVDSDELQWHRISFGCPSLDSITRGGIQTRGITEIFGESGAGKTQLLLQLSLMVQLPPPRGGLGKRAVFICTEDVFPSKRLYQFIDKFKRQYSEKIDYAHNIYIDHVIEQEDLMKTINLKLPKLLATGQIGLIIIDSIAGVFRLESNFIARAKRMRDLVGTVLRYIEKYKCAVICTNQVASSVNSSNSNSFQPCLGLAWANLVSTRFQLSKTQRTCCEPNKNSNQTVIRDLRVVFAPDLSNGNAQFIITSENGIVDAPG